MCPYYNADYCKCKIFNSYPLEETQNWYCKEMRRPYTECPNYNESKRIHGGTVPPPYKYN